MWGVRRELLKVARAAETRERADAALAEAIRAAHEAGESLRTIRDATGARLSHETVRAMIAKAIRTQTAVAE